MRKLKLSHVLVCGTALLMLTSAGIGTPALASAKPSHVRTSVSLRKLMTELKRHGGGSKVVTVTSSKNAPSRHVTKPDAAKPAQPDSHQQFTAQTFSPSGVHVDKSGLATVNGDVVGHVETDPTLESQVAASPHQMVSVNDGTEVISFGGLDVAIPASKQGTYEHDVTKNETQALKSADENAGDDDNAEVISDNANAGDLGQRIQHDLLREINAVRTQNGLPAYTPTGKLQLLTNLRTCQASHAYRTQPKSVGYAHQALGENTTSDDWIHGHDEHETTADDGEFLKLSPYASDDHANKSAECAGDTGFGKTEERDLSYQHVVHADTPAELAHDAITNMVDHDDASNNGHRNAILNPQFQHCAVGVKVYRAEDGELRASYVFDLD